MTARPLWHEGVAPVALDVPGALGGTAHRLTWRRGSLVAEDHVDADAERALEALGGGRCPCLDLLDAWDAHAGDPVVLSVGTRGPNDSVALDRRELDSLVEGPLTEWRREVGTARTYVATTAARTALDREEAAAEGPVAAAEAGVRRRVAFLRLFTLPPALQRRLALTVAARAEAAWHDVAFRRAHAARLEAAVVARAGAALQAALGGGGSVHVEMLPPGAAPSVVATPPTRDGGSAAVDARLPLSWLAGVWGRGLGSVGSAFVLDVVAVRRSALEVLVVELPPAGPGHLTPLPGKVAVVNDVGR